MTSTEPLRDLANLTPAWLTAALTASGALMVLDWAIDVRQHLEGPVLRRYHDQLCARGVAGYAWERLWEDYRLGVPLCVAVAAEYCQGGVNHDTRHSWLPMLQRALTACDDLVGAANW